MRNFTFKLGANVYGRHEHCGQLTKIVIDPHHCQLTDLIVEEGLLFKRALVLPVAQVKEALGQTIILKISNDQLRQSQT